MVRSETWKYLSIGLMAVLAVGFSFPQAFAHITSSLSHNVSHLLDALNAISADVAAVKAKTSNLPNDPASNTVVQTRSSQASVNDLQSDVDAIRSQTDIIPTDPADQSLIDTQLQGIQSSIEGLSGGGSSPKSARIHTTLSPGDGQALTQTILPFETGKTYSGTITGRYLFSEGNTANIFCDVSGVTLAMSLVDFQLNDPLNGINGGFTEVFTCESMRIFVLDFGSNGDAGPIGVFGTIQYFESTEVDEIGD